MKVAFICQMLLMIKLGFADATCKDMLSNSNACTDWVASGQCYRDDVKRACQRSCGLCPGMTPDSSNTCFDQDEDHCPRLARTDCYKAHMKKLCRKSCGLCPGMTPVSSNNITCYDEYDWCPDIASYKCGRDNNQKLCRKSCGLCPGLTPVISNTCFNKYDGGMCDCDNHPEDCPARCGLCKEFSPDICEFALRTISNSTNADECNKSCLKDPKCKSWMIGNKNKECVHWITQENTGFSSVCLDTCESCKAFTPDNLCEADLVLENLNTVDKCNKSCLHNPKCKSWFFLNKHEACYLWIKGRDASRYSTIC